MTVLKEIKRYLLVVLCMHILLLVPSIKSEAKTSIKQKTTFELCVEEYCDEEYGEYYYRDFDFVTTQDLILATSIRIEILSDENDMCFEGGVKIQLIDEYGDYLQNDYLSLKGYSGEEYYDGFFYSDGFNVPAGSYKYRIINTSDCDLEIRLSIDGFDSVSTSAKLVKKPKSKSGNWKKIGRLSKSQMPYIKSVKSKKKGLIKDWTVLYNGEIYVLANKPGVGDVIVTLKNGKKYKTKLTVKAPNPNFYAQLIDYNTRDNYFTVRVKNVGIGNLTILSSGAYSMDVDYKSYDRQLYLSGGKSVVVKPGKSKKIKFKVKGNTTWYKYSDHTIRFYFKYYGKKRLCSVWDEDCSYKDGKKWYTTYWDSDKFMNWQQ